MTTSTTYHLRVCRNEALKSPVLAAFLRLPRTAQPVHRQPEGHLRAGRCFGRFDSARRACRAG